MTAASTPFAPEDFAKLGAPNLVYVREMNVGETLMITGVKPGTRLFAIHSADGTRVGVLDTRDGAFAAALSHELMPASVH